MKILVSGGTGYIGSHTVIQLVQAGHDVVIVDNFSNSQPTVLGRLEALTGTSLPMHSFDLRDYDKTEHLFAAEGFDAVIHFAGFKAVGESVEKPLDYYENNLGSTFSLVRAMQRYDVDKLVFSSSATVYGTDQAGATEDRRTFATNPYGWTKVMQEQILSDVALAAPHMRFALLRYFNPVGAHASGTIGEDPSETPNNLMPYIAQVAVGRRDKLSVFGDDYDTPDGTGVRDYIHVEDLAAGHIAALEKLDDDRRAGQRLEPRLRPRHQRARAAARLREGRRARAALRGRRPAAPATSRRRTPTRPRPTPSSAGAPPAVGRGDVRRHLALAVAEPRGLHQLMLATLGLSVATALLASGPLAGATVVLDPGHQLGNANFPAEINRPVPAGGFTKPCNSTGTATDGGLSRGDLRLAGLAAPAGASWSTSVRTVVMTRTSNRADRWGPCVDVRGRAGNRIRADLKVSIHGDGLVRRRRPRLPRHRARRRGPAGPTTSPDPRWTWLGPSRRGLVRSGVPVANYIAGGDGSTSAPTSARSTSPTCRP